MPASRAIIQTQVLRNQITPSETLEVDLLSALRMAIEAGLGCAILSRATVLLPTLRRRNITRGVSSIRR